MTTSLIISDSERSLLRKTIAAGTTEDQFSLFVQVCRQTGLNPFARQIYAVVRKDRGEAKMTIQTSIDGYRLLAQRSGEYAGQDGPYWYDPETKEWSDVWIKPEPPAAAKVGVMRRGFTHPIYAVARFESYAVRGWNDATRKMDGPLTNLWAKMPELMIAKVAEALALRRAFPAELSGVYTKEEMDQADQPLPSISVAEEIPENSPSEAPQTAQPIQTSNGTDAQKQAISTLLGGFKEACPEKCLPGWKVTIVREALDLASDEAMPSVFTPDDVHRVELHIKSLQRAA